MTQTHYLTRLNRWRWRAGSKEIPGHPEAEPLATRAGWWIETAYPQLRGRAAHRSSRSPYRLPASTSNQFLRMPAAGLLSICWRL